ncbi:SIR2 family protein [Arthrobacter sp. OY3WO11]|uniref:SIR2 family protein n=1 Tax=Arthrobacter sp. OY3WO11 TaxID=1835723 RepID=UPI0007CF0088|nr:SIR2 family protein [Arthrobacter sp. OY3WO11]OAE03103.1 hypothetical protein A6A22_18025 [Arthrobacter sp. OY3WO11]
MTAIGGIAAHAISVTETLELIDANFPSLVDAVSKGEYAFWLGSAISRDRLPPLEPLVGKILDFLQSRIDTTNPNCVYKDAFENILELAMLSEEEEKHCDFSQPVAGWPTHKVIMARLIRRYAEVLDIEIPGQPRDFLLWNVLDVPGVYADSAIAPDIEHYCLAVMILEGLLPDVVTANWDGLIERALEELAGTNSQIAPTYVTSADFRRPRGRTRILKFHGCAVKAKNDENAYRGYLVGRRTQITDWPNDSKHSVMRLEMSSLAISRRTLMIGLSGQDSNIQNLFSSAKELLTWEWPTDPPAFVFAEDKVGPDQQNILRVAYQSTYEGNEAAIAAGSHLRAYGKPLLSALMLATFAKKLGAMVDIAATADTVECQAVLSGIQTLVFLAASGVTSNADHLLRLIFSVGRGLSLFRDGKVSVSGTYMPLSVSPVHQLATDPHIHSGGLPQMAVALGLLGIDHASGAWSVSVKNENLAHLGLTVTSGQFVSQIFFVSNPAVALQLELDGLIDSEDPDLIIIHSGRITQRLQRGPGAEHGRTGRSVARQVGMAEVISEAVTIEDLQRIFREEMSQ